MNFRTRMFPVSERGKRWEDVEVLLAAGIDVLTTMNIQHLESLNDQVWQISGIRVRETVPDWVVQQADEVVMVDLTPGPCSIGCSEVWCMSGRRRSALCRISFGNRPWWRCGSWRFGKPRMKSNIAWWTGEARIPCRQRGVHSPHAKHHKILVLVTANPKTAMVIRRAKRVSDFLGAECFAVAVQPTGDLSGLSAEDRRGDREAFELRAQLAY